MWGTLLLGILPLAGALPGNATKELFEAQIARQSVSEAIFPCLHPECRKPDKKYEAILPAQPGVQWMDHGGYCGSFSIQRTTLTKGAWISEDQVRLHGRPGGGNDNEVLTTNIEYTLKNLKLKFSGFDQTLPVPQKDAYRKWIKKSLVAGHGVVWMIMLSGEKYPVYPSLPSNATYGHVEPVVGIMSDRPLTDPEWYDDDVVVHFTDADLHPYYRTMKSLPDTVHYTGSCSPFHMHYVGYPCINENYGYGWAIEGLDDPVEGLPASLAVTPSDREPDVRTGAKSSLLRGTLTVNGLTKGAGYQIYRWDSVSSAFDYNVPSAKNFTAIDSSFVFEDPTPIISKGSTYYRCVPAPTEGGIIV